MQCSDQDCDRGVWARGYCSKHYYKAQRHGLLSRPKCSVVECDQPSFRKGMCNKHELRQRRHGGPHFRKKTANGETRNSTCPIQGCNRAAKGKGLCPVHAGRKRHHGDPLAEPKKLANGTASDERKRQNRARALRNYGKTPHGKLRRRYSNAKRRVLKGLESSGIPKDEFLKLWASTECALCYEPVSDADKSIDHKIPLSRGGSNDIANMQIAHLLCNQRKSNSLTCT